MAYKLISLHDMLQKLGEDRTRAELSQFSCPLNRDVEKFILGRSAVEFAKQHLTTTYLVYGSFKKRRALVGYFAITSKYIVVSRATLSSKYTRRLNKFAAYDPDLKSYIMSSPLIAQLGKNYAGDYNKLITGDELLYLAIKKIKEAQLILGGKTVYIECEDDPKLKEFYSSNGFVEFGRRSLDRDEKDDFSSSYLIQMLKYLD